MKIGIVFDSSSGLSVEEGNKKGAGVIPLIINLNGKILKAGVDIKGNDLYKLMEKGKTKISTATPIAEDVISEFKKMLKKYDQLIFVGMSMKLSGTYNAVRVIVEGNEDFKEKVHVYESQYSSPWTGLLAEDIIDLAKEAKSVEEVIKKLDYQKDKMIGWLSPGDIYWFYQGGRIDRKQYLIGAALRIKPILTIKDGEINKDSVIKGISIKSALSKMIKESEVVKDQLDQQGVKYQFVVLDGGNDVLMNQTMDAIVNYFGVDKKEIISTPLSSEQVAHMGPEAFGITFKVFYK